MTGLWAAAKVSCSGQQGGWCGEDRGEGSGKGKRTGSSWKYKVCRRLLTLVVSYTSEVLCFLLSHVRSAAGEGLWVGAYGYPAAVTHSGVW